MSWFSGLKDGWKIAERTQEILLLSIYLPDIERRLRKEKPSSPSEAYSKKKGNMKERDMRCNTGD